MRSTIRIKQTQDTLPRLKMQVPACLKIVSVVIDIKIRRKTAIYGKQSTRFLKLYVEI